MSDYQLPEDWEYFCDLCNHKVHKEELYENTYGFDFLCPNCYLNVTQAHQRGGWVDMAKEGKEEALHFFRDGISLCLFKKIEGMPEFKEPGHVGCFCIVCLRMLDQGRTFLPKDMAS